MKNKIRGALCAAIAAWLGAGAVSPAQAQSSAANPNAVRQERPVTRASGTFEVKMAPLAPYNDAEGAGLGRMSLDKVFHGDLAGTGKGEMLAAMTPVEGSAGYVAVERVTGTLGGRAGTFVLQHSGTMNRGAPSLAISVVPDSGTGELEGIAGTMTIDVSGGKHSYVFEYTLPGAP